MAEHWCKEHQMAWFKKGKMKGYAHPILNEEGEPMGEWCNEPKQEEAQTEKSKSSPRDSSTNDSIESQVAFKGIVELISADKIKINDPIAFSAITWAITRLGGNIEKSQSPKAEVKSQPVPEPSKGITTDELLKYVAEKKNWKTSVTARSWLVNKCQIDDARIDTETEAVYNEVKELMGW